MPRETHPNRLAVQEIVSVKYPGATFKFAHDRRIELRRIAAIQPPDGPGARLATERPHRHRPHGAGGEIENVVLYISEPTKNFGGRG